MGMIKEFKEFAAKGNLVDMAVGIAIGAAFGTVSSSFVADIFTPLLSMLFGSPDFSNLFVILQDPAVTEGVDMTSVASIREAGGVVLAYGLFVNAVISFLIIAFALFLVIKGMNRMKKKEEPAPAPAPAGPSETDLLTEIRDLLKK
ncbi:MAG: large conductance mechanosensitive channel protein MscL [Flavobacteriales bacterium]|nr:large conductance mechanosensitive channel protein MscL [Bacteroidota bacterium]MCB9240823.1 large conductance mechanosensitive channel protein MscL [Flavobacteriales bacterium]